MTWLVVVACSIAALVLVFLADQRALRYGQRVGGHRPPDPLPPALERLKRAYAAGGISLETFEKRLSWLFEHGKQDSTTPVEYEVPEPGGLPPATRIDAAP